MISKPSGFSLLELMVSVALVAIVLAWGIPSSQALIRDIRLTTTVNELITAIQLTRSEAIKRSSRVTLCKSMDGSNCATSGGFEQGAGSYSPTPTTTHCAITVRIWCES